MDSSQIVLPLIVVAGLAVAWWRQPPRRGRRAIARAVHKHLAETRAGERVAFRGVVSGTGEALRSPLTGRACLAYSFMVRTTRYTFMSVAAAERHVSFVVVADGQEAVVRGEVLLALEPRRIDQQDCPGLDDLLYEPGAARSTLFRTTYRCEEALLCAGDLVTVLGRASVEVDQAGVRETPRGPPVRRTIGGDSWEPVIVGAAPDARKS